MSSRQHQQAVCWIVESDGGDGAVELDDDELTGGLQPRGDHSRGGGAGTGARSQDVVTHARRHAVESGLQARDERLPGRAAHGLALELPPQLAPDARGGRDDAERGEEEAEAHVVVVHLVPEEPALVVVLQQRLVRPVGGVAAGAGGGGALAVADAAGRARGAGRQPAHGHARVPPVERQEVRQQRPRLVRRRLGHRRRHLAFPLPHPTSDRRCRSAG